MTTEHSPTRRQFVATAAGTAAAVSLAGCTGGGEGDGDSTEYLDEEPEYSDWFSNANGYDQTVDATGQDEVTVEVGTSDNPNSYGPAAVAVDAGTTVVWEWTGEGSPHNVVSRDDLFESEETQAQGHTFEHTFEEAGNFEYYCDPHETVGMKGAVHVE